MMAKNKEGEEMPSSVGQSKRGQQSQPATVQDSDSPSHHAHHPRAKPQKHIVGGGAGRLHARVPSSKALHKHAREAAAVAATAVPPPLASHGKRPQIQRRVTAEAHTPSRINAPADLPKDLRQDLPQAALKRNTRSHVELPNTTSKSHKTQVHFDLGNEEDEEEWVDASGSASPYLSRRTSVASTSSRPPNTPSTPVHPSSASARLEPTITTPITTATTGNPTTNTTTTTPTAAATATTAKVLTKKALTKELDPSTSQHNQYLTTRLLQRIPSHNAIPPQISSETVEVPMHHRSPEQQQGQDTSLQSSTMSGTPQTNNTSGSNLNDELSSRFINNSIAANDGSFYTPADGASAEARRANGNTNGPRRPLSVGSLAHGRRGDMSPVDDGDGDGDGGQERAGEGDPSQPPLRRPLTADVSRTQRKLDLQRQSSTLEPSPVLGGGIGGPSPLISGASDPRAGKMLERIGMEYRVVRRYQNPVARSIAALDQFPSAARSQRIPPPVRTSTAGSRMSGLGQGFRQPADLQQSRPVTPHRGGSAGGARQNVAADGSFGRQEEELSGASLVENTDDGTAALLKAMWDRRMDFASASQ